MDGFVESELTMDWTLILCRSIDLYSSNGISSTVWIVVKVEANERGDAK